MFIESGGQSVPQEKVSSRRNRRMRRATKGEMHRPFVAVSRWAVSPYKRGFDIFAAIILLTVLAPLMLLIAFLVKLTSQGPVLFRQRRLGRQGRTFEILKFRTMLHQPSQQGPGLTTIEDSRLTPIGKILRRWKLDEFPQLFNILRGDMGFVGPRPKLPQLELKQGGTLAVRPGVTGVATLAFRHEEALLQGLSQDQIESFYIDTIAPLKVQLDLDYMRRATLYGDLKLILQTVISLFWRSSNLHFRQREELLGLNGGLDQKSYERLALEVGKLS
jgi:lipopolysaccharide/colanic/teichoic acid biosynthesis glycosyltransferase